jgi:hypothetical protein
MASSTTGTCALCQTADINLCKSHLLPKAMYRWMRLTSGNAKNPNPILLTQQWPRRQVFRSLNIFSVLPAKVGSRKTARAEYWQMDIEEPETSRCDLRYWRNRQSDALTSLRWCTRANFRRSTSIN